MPEQWLVYQLEIAGNVLPVREVNGFEALSQPFLFEVQLVMPPDKAVDPDDIIKSEAKLVLIRDGAVRTITALVGQAFCLVGFKGQVELTVMLEPHFGLLRYKSNIKVFRNKTVPQIVAEVLGESGVAFEQRLSASYPIRPYTVQHRETDLAFVSRMLEEEGIFYFFTESMVMVMGDSPAAYDSLGPIPFFDDSSMDRNAEAVCDIGPVEEASVGQVTLRDWNPEKPSLNMDVQAKGPTPAGPEYYDYPGEYLEPGDGRRIAKLHAEAYECRAWQHAGRSYVGGFAPGRTFDLQHPPLGVAEISYAIISVKHLWHREQTGFDVEFTALEADRTFRPRPLHPEPLLPNPVTAIVTGPPGEDIYTEELGRVKVHFHWDRLQPYDGECSDWVPVLQDNTGHSVAHPRIGWEVLVHYLEGDPDRPVVLGRVYNAEDHFQSVLPRDKHRTELGSLSSPTRDGYNVIQIQDEQGREHISVHAEKDQNIVVANNKTEDTLFNETSQVRNDETIQIGVDNTVTVNNQVLSNVTGNQSLTVGGNLTRTASADEQITVDKNHTLSVGGMHQHLVGTADSMASEILTESVGGVIVEATKGTNGSLASEMWSLTVGGAIVEVAGKEKTESAVKGRIETIGGVVLTKAGQEIKTNVDKNRITTIGGAMLVNAVETLSLTAKELFTGKSAIGEHVGDKCITLKVGETVLTMQEGLIKLVASDAVAFKVSGSNEQGADESYQI